MDNSNDIERVQVHIDEVKAAIAFSEELERLNKVPEFESVIIKGFMQDEPARLAQIITDPSLLDDENQKAMLGAFRAVGYLGDYLRNIEKRGIMLKAKLQEAEEYQENLRNPNKDD